MRTIFGMGAVVIFHSPTEPEPPGPELEPRPGPHPAPEDWYVEFIKQDQASTAKAKAAATAISSSSASSSAAPPGGLGASTSSSSSSGAPPLPPCPSVVGRQNIKFVKANLGHRFDAMERRGFMILYEFLGMAYAGQLIRSASTAHRHLPH